LGGADLPGGVYAVWFQSWGWLLFVTGVVSVEFGYLGTATRPGVLPDEAAYVVNPLPIDFLPHDVLEPLVLVFLALTALGGVGTLIRTYRRGGETERLQLKWLMSAVTFLGLAFTIAITLSFVVPDFMDRWLKPFEFIVFVGMMMVPASIGFAVTRYRLYDIEVVINRAIVYGPLTAVVAASYVGAVQLARLTFVAATGERSDSELLLATLVAGAVFWIIKARMIGVVDRHFKDPRGPAKDLRVLRNEIQSLTRLMKPSAISRDEVTRHVLQGCVTAFGAEGGRVVFERRQVPARPIVAGNLDGEPSAVFEIAHDGVVFGELQMGTRREGKAFSEHDSAPLVETASALAAVLARGASGAARAWSGA
jgi:hypothetical protein